MHKQNICCKTLLQVLGFAQVPGQQSLEGTLIVTITESRVIAKAMFNQPAVLTQGIQLTKPAIKAYYGEPALGTEVEQYIRCRMRRGRWSRMAFYRFPKKRQDHINRTLNTFQLTILSKIVQTFKAFFIFH